MRKANRHPPRLVKKKEEKKKKKEKKGQGKNKRSVRIADRGHLLGRGRKK